MVHLLKMVIFHGYVSHNQMVNSLLCSGFDAAQHARHGDAGLPRQWLCGPVQGGSPATGAWEGGGGSRKPVGHVWDEFCWCFEMIFDDYWWFLGCFEMSFWHKLSGYGSKNIPVHPKVYLLPKIFLDIGDVPSGKRLHNCAKTIPFLMGKSIISMAIFNSYVTNYKRVHYTSIYGYFTQSLCLLFLFFGRKVNGPDWWPGPSARVRPGRRSDHKTGGCVCSIIRSWMTIGM